MLSIKEFHKIHPYPDFEEIEYLFKFFRFNDEHPEYLSVLFEEANLYHSLPSVLNDPFECRPHFKYPDTGQDAAQLRKHLIKLAKSSGLKTKYAEKIASTNMTKPDLLKEGLENSIQKVFSQVRICCFTRTEKNLLCWSHYADSHRGLCVKFNAKLLPLSFSFKVKYQEEYPVVGFPLPKDIRAFRPLLTKSNVWEYEAEYRSFLYPSSSINIPKNKTSYILSPDIVQAVYFGANMENRNIEKVKKMVKNGPFQPELWKAELKKDSYSIEFHKIS